MATQTFYARKIAAVVSTAVHYQYRWRAYCCGQKVAFRRRPLRRKPGDRSGRAMAPEGASGPFPRHPAWLSAVTHVATPRSFLPKAYACSSYSPLRANCYLYSAVHGPKGRHPQRLP